MQDLVPLIRRTKIAIPACLIALVVFASAALADELTPVGAQKAGSADGRIPAWTGDKPSKPLPGWSFGKVRFDYWEHKDEKPLFIIDASNVDKYAANLTEGQIALLKSLKGYTMPVYKSYRECAYPDYYVENTKLNAAGRAKINANDGWALEDAMTPGMPFPNPKSGIEAVWDHLTRWSGLGNIWKHTITFVSPRPGGSEPIIINYKQNFFLPSGGKGSHSIKETGSVESMVYYGYNTPPALAGQAIVQRFYFGKDLETYYYFPGQHRVRRLPSYAYDAPEIGYENQYPCDMPYVYCGNPDRFDWKIVGWKEIYVPYNNFKQSDFTIPLEQGCLRNFVNPDLRRYELHRVREVVGTVKANMRHSTPKKTLFLDEDTGSACVGDDYDAKGEIWKVKEASLFPIWEIEGVCMTLNQVNFYDLISGRYLSDEVEFGTGEDLKYCIESSEDPKLLNPDFYTAESLRAYSER